jgi:predicted RNA-binding Zn-ribbon protein involved in translation (DUF1610 family)
MNSSLKFDCPRCGKNQHIYLNTSAQRRKGENEKTCDGCGRRIIIDITIYTDGEDGE